MSELENRMLEYRGKFDIRLDKTQPLLAMIDGRSFSKLIKNKYTKPFDSEFIKLMNSTAEYCIAKIQCCKFAYVQSDEISFFIDSRHEESNPFFEYRICKLLSIIPSMATGIFNKLRFQKDPDSPLCEFDCKVWNVPTDNDVFAWFLYRQNDCIRNSKSQTAQSFLPHKELLNLNVDQQLEKLLSTKGIDWNSYEDGMKYGRFIWKEQKEYNSPEYGTYMRSVYEAKPAWQLNGPEGRHKFFELLELKEYEEPVA